LQRRSESTLVSSDSKYKRTKVLNLVIALT
jgi:hypothetical protein